MNKSNFEKALDFFLEELNTLKDVPSSEEKDMKEAECIMNIGRVYQRVGNHQKAIDFYNKSSQKLESSNTKPALELKAAILNNIGNAHLYQGNLETALMIMHKLLTFIKEKLPSTSKSEENFRSIETSLPYIIPAHPTNSLSVFNIGRIYNAQNKENNSQYNVAILEEN